MEADLHVAEIDMSIAELRTSVGNLRKQSWATVYPEARDLPDAFDPHDETAYHWGVFHEDQLVASGRLSLHESIHDVPDAEVYVGVIDSGLAGPIASINRLVVAPAYRRRGIARLLDLTRVQAAQKLGCRYVVGSSPTDERRLNQLCEIGFSDLGPGQSYGADKWCQRKDSRILLKTLD